MEDEEQGTWGKLDAMPRKTSEQRSPVERGVMCADCDKEESMSDYFYGMCRTWWSIILKKEDVSFFWWLFFIVTLPVAPAYIFGWFVADLSMTLCEKVRKP